MLKRRLAPIAVIPLVVGVIVGPLGGSATAGNIALKQVVSDNPVGWTPHVLDGTVNALTKIGNRVIVGGSFSEVRDAGGKRTHRRDNLFAFSLKTGRIDRRFTPEIDGPVHALAPGGDGTVYAGGSFSMVNGSVRPSLARVALRDGRTAGSLPRVSAGSVFSLVRHGSHLYVGGDFLRIGRERRPAITRLDAATGAVDPAFAVTPSRARGGDLRVHAMAGNRRGTRLAMLGSFTAVDGKRRPQVALIDISKAARPRLAKWATEAYADDCSTPFPWYVRGIDFSPTGKYFVVVTTGGWRGGGPLCDTAARFETRAPGGTKKVRPTWINHTGGDSLYSVAVTGAAVYVGGHQRWLNNPKGKDSRGPGAVYRPGIGAIHPRTGRALAWNPTRERGVGVKAFLAHKGGLLVGSDTEELGREYHARVGMFPAA